MADEKPEDKEEGLEAKVDEGIKEQKEKGFFRKAVDLAYISTLGAATTALALATAGGSLGPWIGGALGAGGFIGKTFRGKESLYERVYESIKTYSIINAIISPMVLLADYTLPTLGAIGEKIAGPVGSFLTKSLYSVGPYLGVFHGLFKGTDHLIENYGNPTGIQEHVSNNFVPEYKRLLFFTPALVAFANGIPTINMAVGNYSLGVPGFAANAFPYSIGNHASPLEDKKTLEPKPSEAKQPVQKMPAARPAQAPA
jgi:hypothetical protein|tara:strand:+ start:232 stop:999 length:768 start_codon:yes stop_codon:yes gene_type:complete